MDFVFGLPRDAQGRSGILVFVDRFSKMVHLAPVAATITAPQSAAIFVDTVYRHHGLPTSIVSDRDPRFTATFWSELFKLVGTRLKMSTASHPETDGQTERANRVLEDVLKSFATSFKSWSSFLPMVEFALNNAVHSSAGLTPFFVNHGRHPRVPALLGMERSTVRDPATDSHGRAPGVSSPSVNGVTTRRNAPAPVPTILTRSAARAASDAEAPSRRLRPDVALPATSPDIPAWTSRTLINPRQRPRAIEYEPVPDAADSAVSPPANFDPNPEPDPRDVAAAHEFMQRRESVICYVRNAIAVAVDRQKEYADRRGRKNVERFVVGNRVLLSTAGIRPTAVTNLGASKLAPRFIGPFKVTKVLGDVYTLLLPTALRLHPTFYVGRLRRYLPTVIPRDDSPTAAPDDAALRSPAPVAQPDPPKAVDSARSQPPPTGHAVRFQRDGPAPLVDNTGHTRHIVESILRHDDSRDATIPDHRHYLVRWLGPMDDSWEPRAVLLADVPDCVAAYEAALAGGAVANRA
ncbi:hypothetical protein F442_14088 [Phytophthora nicotianae P10297]|uniref:Integrase catalytic domain-containing protein n=1 Tax=Phytophthora nicotianae P10297 TaxID=1317064 RepID=W2YTM0_PHYNI|nr:hypothetical protein F442_14088 [Phytophthora nicotianae P10297]